MHSHIRPYLPSKSPSWNKLRQLSGLGIWPTSEAMTLLEQGDRGQNRGLCGWVMLGPQFFGWFCRASNPGVISQRGCGCFRWINMIQINWEKISTYTVTYPALYWMFCNRGSLIVQKSAGEFLVDRCFIISLFIGYRPYKVVQDFFHPQYHRVFGGSNMINFSTQCRWFVFFPPDLGHGMCYLNVHPR